ncbi:hypothetical protein CYY_008995 [Polysphondylium violaceum]|uniref:Peptidase C1A papain C-terminal domain-containing protein n=1 Tax=Polysphondylium violaceum TaxID=133409 RepID=A0A8J4PKV9_9MYCE|nr:hypothetical protein CYY_008995 [Polysphondylium violaceum]
MRGLLVALFISLCLIQISYSFKVVHPATIDRTIHHPTWVEEKNNFFSKTHMKFKSGFKKNPNREEIPALAYSGDISSLPDTFDSRTEWSNCSTIGAIQNQARCGSCWAFGAVSSVSDRFCIHKQEDIQLSFQDLVTCDQSDNGCEGGDDVSAYNFIKKKGIVSAACSPYTIPTCPPAQQPCLNFVSTPKCVQKCQNDTIDYASDKHHLSSIYSIPDVASMMKDLVANGPYEVCFDVYEDFLGYKSGVYQHTTGKFLGGHCVKLLGYGTENNTPYWLLANQWTTYWGDQGFFKILRGKNECGIEAEAVGGIPL